MMRCINAIVNDPPGPSDMGKTPGTALASHPQLTPARLPSAHAWPANRLTPGRVPGNIPIKNDMDGKFSSLRRPARYVLAAAAAFFVLSLFMKGRLPGPSEVRPELLQDPVQTEEGLPEPFEVVRGGVTYTVNPLYSYELWGLVVSSHNADSFLDISHEAWNDKLNVKDVCVVWGRNLTSGVLKYTKFKNRDFTCYYSVRDADAASLFRGDCLSNNHLLPADSMLGDAVKRVRRGDQVHFKGWLVTYGIKGSGFNRGTSTTRKDQGNGACETVFVNEFEVLRRAEPAWFLIGRTAPIIMALCIAVILFA
jgi:hypothetical protein